MIVRNKYMCNRCGKVAKPKETYDETCGITTLSCPYCGYEGLMDVCQCENPHCEDYFPVQPNESTAFCPACYQAGKINTALYLRDKPSHESDLLREILDREDL